MNKTTLCLCIAWCAAMFAASCDAPDPGATLLDGNMDITEHNGDSIWRLEVDGMVDRGYFYPDEHVVYWSAKLPKLDGQAAHFEVRGEFPDARFMSVQGYTQKGAALEGLYDYQILPSATGTDSYSVIVSPGARPAGADAATPNTLYLYNDAGDANFTIVYRVYWNALGANAAVPDGYDRRQWEKQGQKPLPAMHYVVDDLAMPHYASAAELYDDIRGALLIRSLADCINALGRCLAPLLEKIDTGIGRLAHDPSQWFIGGDFVKGFAPLFENYPLIKNFLNSRRAVSVSPYPNNATVYYAAYLNPRYGEINVTRFKAPTFPDTEAGEAIDPAAQQVRYWSVCIHNPLLMYTTACMKDSDFTRDEDNFVTVVFSKAGQRPNDPSTGKPVHNWLPVSSPNALVFLRHMLPAPWFVQSAYYYKQSAGDSTLLNDYSAISAWSGEYGPESVYCSRQQFEAETCGREWLNQ